MNINSPAKQGSHVYKTGISLWCDVSSRFAGTFLFLKCMNDIFKNYRKTFVEKRNRNGSLVEQYSMKNSKIFHKDKNGACCDENNMDSEVEVTFCSKDKGKRRVLYGVLS